MREVEYLKELTSRYPVLEAVKDDVLATYEVLRDCYIGDDKVMIAGNGGGCADNEHIVGELMKGFAKHRPVSGELAAAFKKTDEKRGGEPTSCLQGGLPTIALTGYAGLSITFFNDASEKMIYAQQLYGYGKRNDVFMGISTSGDAEDAMYAMAVAKASGTRTVGLTGKSGGRMAGACGYSIVVPSDETFEIQELHLPIYHTLCLILEEHSYEV